MSDRLTQLQDTINLVKYIFSVNIIELSTLIHSVLLLISHSKLNTFATASVFCSNVRFQVNFLGLNASGINNHLKIHKKTMHNCFQHSYLGKVEGFFWRFRWISRTYQLTSFFFFRCAKDIDTLIESLPNEDSSQELQAQSLRRLEVENQEAAKRLEEVSFWSILSGFFFRETDIGEIIQKSVGTIITVIIVIPDQPIQNKKNELGIQNRYLRLSRVPSSNTRKNHSLILAFFIYVSDCRSWPKNIGKNPSGSRWYCPSTTRYGILNIIINPITINFTSQPI